MQNVLIGYGNVVDKSALSGGAWQPTLPLSNLQDRRIGKVARTLDMQKSSTQFLINVGPNVLTRTIALVNHNLSLAAQCRIRASNDPTFATVIQDTGWLAVWPSLYDSLSLDWQALNWWYGRPLLTDIQGYNWTTIVSWPGTINACYYLIEFDDQENYQGSVQLGRVFIGQAWQPTLNMSYNTNLSWEDNTVVNEALSGAEYFDQRTPYRVAKFSIDNLTDEEAFTRPFDIMRQMGVSGEVIFQYDPDDTVLALRRQWYGRMRTLNAIENPYWDHDSVAFEIKELI